MHSSYLLVNDLRFHYLYWNWENAGQPALLLHGLASNARFWELAAPHLVQAGLAPVAVDLRGHGLSDKPDGDYSFDTYLGDLAALMDALHLEKPLLVGHSWGAMLALAYAARNPFGPRAPSGIILVDGGATQFDSLPGSSREELRARLTPPRLAGTPLDDFLKMLHDPAHKWLPGEAATSIILANFEITDDSRCDCETIAPHLSFEHHMQIVDAMLDFKTYASLARLRCPALAIPARPAPPLSVEESEYLERKQRGLALAQKANPNLQVHWLEDSVHDIPLQRPAELAALIADFAARLPVSS